MDNIEITKAGISDFDELKALGMLTFTEAFAAVNTEANMQKYLSENFTYGKLSSELSNPGSAFYFAKENNRPIGYLKLNVGDAQTELKDINAVEIERIYVLKEYYGKKIGQLLFQKAMDIALERKAAYLWLGVWEENIRAIAFYLKNGFRQFDSHIFKLGDDVQTDIMMKLVLAEM